MITKNIYHKIKLHPLFYFLLIISSLTGHFRSVLIFTIIILVHELGHFLTGYILGWKCIKIDIYPYGGCSNFSVPINIPLKEEFLVLIMGPLIQIIFIFIIKHIVDVETYNIFKLYSTWILYFNLLPIFPLDGGKFIQLILSKFISYYLSIRLTIYISYFTFISIFLTFLFMNFNLIIFLIFILLGISLYKEIKKSYFYYQSFLLERYMNNFIFKKRINIIQVIEMKRDKEHIISGLEEKIALKQYFNS